jgi:hypothetical protein
MSLKYIVNLEWQWECISVWGNDRRMQAHAPIIPPNYPQSEIHPGSGVFGFMGISSPLSFSPLQNRKSAILERGEQGIPFQKHRQENIQGGRKIGYPHN